MYTEEYLGEDSFDENDVSSYDSESSLDTIMREKRHITKLYKQSDADYYTYKHNVEFKKKKSKHIQQVCVNLDIFAMQFLV